MSGDFNKSAGGCAFPIALPGIGDNGIDGMSMRDYFAARAMAAIFKGHGTFRDIDRDWMLIVAAKAYLMADAMLAERDRK